MQVSATTVREFTGWAFTEDGTHLMLKFVDRNGAERFLAIPLDQTKELATYAVAGRMNVEAMSAADDGRTLAFNVDNLVVKWPPGGSPVTLTLTFEGLPFTFQLTDDMVRILAEGFKNWEIEKRSPSSPTATPKRPPGHLN